MAVTLLNIIAIQLPTATTSPIFAGSTTKATLVKNILLTNTGSASEQVNIYLKIGGATAPGRLISPKNMQIPANSQVILDAEVTLATTASSADQIYGSTTTASTVDCVINGMQRDL